MWRGIKTLTDCKRSTTQISEDRDLPDTLNQAQGGADTPPAPPAKTTAQSPWPKCFQRMMLSHVKNRLPADVGSHHFAYRANRCAEDAASITLHTALSHMEHPNTYVRMRFIEALPSIPSPPPLKWCINSKHLGLSTSLCSWRLDRPQNVSIGNLTLTILNTGALQTCFSNTIETHCREEGQRLADHITPGEESPAEALLPEEAKTSRPSPWSSSSLLQKCDRKSVIYCVKLHSREQHTVNVWHCVCRPPSEEDSGLLKPGLTGWGTAFSPQPFPPSSPPRLNLLMLMIKPAWPF